MTKDYKEFTEHLPAHCYAEPVDKDMFHWLGRIIAPPGSIYKGGIFFMDIYFPHSYPHSPPKVTFRTKIYHPNIDGSVQLPLLNA